MTTLNPIDAAIAKANAAKAEAAANPQTVELYKAPSENGAVATYVAPRQKTLDDLSNAGLNVDEFLKVDKYGFTIKGKEGLFEELLVSIDTSKIQVFEGVRFGNPATYYKTYDGAKAAHGGNWLDALKKAQMADPTVKTYEGADIEMVALETVKVTSKGKETVVVEKGTTLKAFIDEVTKQGLRGAVVEVKVIAEKRTNKNGNEWGVLNFELLGEYAG
jgi:hypothetical protein